MEKPDRCLVEDGLGKEESRMSGKEGATLCLLQFPGGLGRESGCGNLTRVGTRE